MLKAITIYVLVGLLFRVCLHFSQFVGIILIPKSLQSFTRVATMNSLVTFIRMTLNINLNYNALFSKTYVHLLFLFQGTLMLADHPTSRQKSGYLFGRNMALAWQAHKDISVININNSNPFNLINAPLMFHLEYDTSYYEKLMKDVESEKVDYREIKEIVKIGPGISKSEEMYKELSENALKVLGEFHECEAKVALKNIIKSM